jgi:hypothetical protein
MKKATPPALSENQQPLYTRGEVRKGFAGQRRKNPESLV